MPNLIKLVLSVFICTYVLGADKVYTVAYYNAYPHMYEKEKRAVGAGIKFIEDIARNTGVKIRLRYYPVKRAVQMLKQGKVDMVLGLIKNNDRKKSIQFGKHPVVTSTPCLVTNHEVLKSKEKVLEDGGVLLLPYNFIIESLVSENLENFDFTYVHDKRPMKKIIDLLKFRRNVYGLIQVCIPDFYEKAPVRTIPLTKSKSEFYLGFSKNIDSSVINSFDDTVIMMEEKGMGYFYFLREYVHEMD